MFTMLFGCTGNRCRSPYAEAYFASLVEDLPVKVLSAGTLDAPGNLVPTELIEIGQGAGLDLGSHRSVYLVETEAEEVDVFIGFERAHVASAVVEAGIDAGKAFTLPELVRLAGDVDVSSRDPEEHARAVVSAADALRKEGNGFVPGEEIADPFRRSRDVYERVAAEITELCDQLHESLFPRTS
jgi:protein-tyrosine-phosphatase